ncbi:MAG: peptidase S10 [Methylovirgula sp.]|jgi:carboxypeptidase C (cathepsin A)
MARFARLAPLLCLSVLLWLSLAFPLSAADDDAGGKGAPASEQSQKPTTPPNPLPAAVTTEQTLQLPDRTLHFKATAGAIRLSNAETGAPLADVAYVYFQLEGTDPAKRPVTIAINGGPGAGSAWLDLGGLGPWRIPLLGEGRSAAANPVPMPNADTWLDFTDLVFIDPPGTGYSRILSSDADVKKSFYSVDGDINTLSVVIRKWIDKYQRVDSPKFIVGESYGGFRAPKLTNHLETHEGVGITGLVMVSPVLDFAWFDGETNPMVYVTHLPSLVAAARDLKGPDPRKDLADVEAYAAGPYIVDLLKGERDTQAVARISEQVAKFTGLDPALVRKLGGRVDSATFVRERNRASGQVGSMYDALTLGYDSYPHLARSDYPDPLLDVLRAPFASAMTYVYENKLNWIVDARYEILNDDVNRDWDWGKHQPAEAMDDLRHDLALDSNLHATIVHGVTDQVTPYFASKLLIDQVPPMGDPNRLKLVVLGGGHMVYALDPSRAALRDAGKQLIESK